MCVVKCSDLSNLHKMALGNYLVLPEVRSYFSYVFLKVTEFYLRRQSELGILFNLGVLFSDCSYYVLSYALCTSSRDKRFMSVYVCRASQQVLF